MTLREAMRGTASDLRAGIAYSLIGYAFRLHPCAAVELVETVARTTEARIARAEKRRVA